MTNWMILVLVAPGIVHVLVVDRPAEHLGVTVGELAVERPNSAISVGQTNVKSLGQKT
jgi:hypothetical protein